MVKVTKKAAERLKELMAEKDADGMDYNPETVGLRVFVQGGGCSGFQYGMQIEKEPNAGTDTVFESNGVRIFVDPISEKYLKDAEVEFDDFSGGFTIKNPNAVSTCGCGKSFQV